LLAEGAIRDEKEIKMTDQAQVEQLAVNTIRALAMDGVQKANSGHPGLPMGMADVAYVLWAEILKHNPKDPTWWDRDRFVLSAGHGSMLLYSVLHLTGYDLPLDELKRFRQWGSLTPGHPEHGLTPGVEMTTGPLGQGFSSGVGMALAERMLAARFNRPGHEIIDHNTYAIVSDGDLMEGISSEAASLAGTLGLSNLIYFYDDNEISIEGDTDLSFTECVPDRFKAYNWFVQEVDGHDRAALREAVKAAQAEEKRPSLIVCHSHIGYGSPNKQDKESAHGAPLGEDEVKLTKENLGFPTEPLFHVPQEVADLFAWKLAALAEAQEAWQARYQAYVEAYPAEAAELELMMSGELPDNWETSLPKFETGASIATRNAGGTIMNAIAPSLPSLVGGSADLSPSTKTMLTSYGDIAAGDYSGRNFHFGIREHAMGAILNGLSLHGGFRPFGSTFLVFSDYVRPSVRLAAIMEQPVIYVFTHDSIFVGEDGPTHEPIEQVAALRIIPNVTSIRPADANETAAAWRAALENMDGPSVLFLSRQNLTVFEETKALAMEGVSKGAYVLSDVEGEPDMLLLASGSEVSLVMAAQKELATKDVSARVVSMPSWELFEAQNDEYKASVLPASVTRRLAVEAGVPFGWHKYVGGDGDVVAIENRFGSSAPYQILAKEYGFTVDNVVERALALMA
jgi:transketolase